MTETSSVRFDAAAPPSKSKGDVLHAAVEDYHDQYHTGTYAECWGCTEVHMFFQARPDLRDKL